MTRPCSKGLFKPQRFVDEEHPLPVSGHHFAVNELIAGLLGYPPLPFDAGGLLWGSTGGGVLGERAEFIPVEGRALEFKLDSPEQGLIDVEFIEDDQGAVHRSQFCVPGTNLRGTGLRKRP